MSTAVDTFTIHRFHGRNTVAVTSDQADRWAMLDYDATWEQYDCLDFQDTADRLGEELATSIVNCEVMRITARNSLQSAWAPVQAFAKANDATIAIDDTPRLSLAKMPQPETLAYVKPTPAYITHEDQVPYPNRFGEGLRSDHQITDAVWCLSQLDLNEEQLKCLALVFAEWGFSKDQAKEVFQYAPAFSLTTAFGYSAEAIKYHGAPKHTPIALSLEPTNLMAAGPHERAARDAGIPDTAIEQLRIVCGLGYRSLAHCLGPVLDLAPDGSICKPTTGNNPPNPTLRTALLGQGEHRAADLGRVLAKKLPYCSPAGLVRILQEQGVSNHHKMVSLYNALLKHQVEAWKQWCKPFIKQTKVDLKISRAGMRIALLGMCANRFLCFDNLKKENVWQDPDNLFAPKGERYHSTHDHRWGQILELAFGAGSVTIGCPTVAMNSVARGFCYDPARDLLESLPKWDGISRFGELLELMHATNDQIHRDMMWWWTAGMAARITEPGAKADYVLLLVGDQGVRKTSLFEIFACKKAWAGTIALHELTKDPDKLGRKIQGRLIINIDEFGSIPKKDRDVVKSFITLSRDDFHVLYQGSTEQSDRCFVIGGTSNTMNTLSDPTGDRRYLPIHLEETLTDADIRAVEAIWPLVLAEARDRNLSGEQRWPTAAQMEALREHQSEGGFKEEDDAGENIHQNITDMVLRGIGAFTAFEALTGHLRNYDKHGMEQHEKFLDNKKQGHVIKEAIASWRGPKGEKIEAKRAKVSRCNKDGKSAQIRCYCIKKLANGKKTLTLDDMTTSNDRDFEIDSSDRDPNQNVGF